MAARKSPKKQARKPAAKPARKPAAARKRPASFTAAAQRKFLDHLAETSNISASARIAGVTTSPIYRLHRKSAEFRRQWGHALCQGYARIEAALVQEAMVEATGNTKDSTLKARAQKQRVRLALLSHHRASVKDYTEDKKEADSKVSIEGMRAELIAKLNLMRERMNQKRAK